MLLIFCLALSGKGYCLDWKILHEQADRDTLSQAEEKFDADAGSLNDLYVAGLVCLNQHRNDEAENIFNKIIALDPQYYPAKWGIAEVFRRNHQLGQAKKMSEEVIKDYPDFFPAYLTLAYTEYLKLNLNRSASLALAVIKHGKKKVDLANLSRAYLLYGGSKGLIAYHGGPISKVINGTSVLLALKKAQALQPDSAETFLGLGTFYILAPGVVGGDLEKGIEFLNKAAKADPQLPAVYVRLAQAYKIKGNQAKYAEYLNQALKIDPENEFALDTQSGECKYACKP